MGQADHGNSGLNFSLNMRTIQLKSQLTAILTHYYNRITILKRIKSALYQTRLKGLLRFLLSHGLLSRLCESKKDFPLIE